MIDTTPIADRALKLFNQCNASRIVYIKGKRCTQVTSYDFDPDKPLTQSQYNKIIKVDIMADNAFNTYKAVKDAIVLKGYSKKLRNDIDLVWTKYFDALWKGDYQGEVADFMYDAMDRLQEHVEPHRQKLGYAIQSKLMMIETERRKQVVDLELCLVDLQCANKIMQELTGKESQMLLRLHELIFKLMNQHAGQLAEAVNLADSKQILLAAKIYETNVIEYELFNE